MNTANTTLVIGASGGIGSALCAAWHSDGAGSVIGVSRNPVPESLAHSHDNLTWYQTDYSATSITRCAQRIISDTASAGQSVTRICICNGILHAGDIQPEKRLEQIDADNIMRVLEVNSVTPVMWFTALLPLIPRKRRCVITTFSARIGSIGDNRSGGWYSYRASKAALNMFMQSASIEMARRFPLTKLVAFHPGTTDTSLSRPFQANVNPEDLMQADYVAGALVDIMNTIEVDGKLSFIDWEGKSIEW
jgi:NAD(P)-dependent dehydrogenase (short-subunit alcohol dehydrogenase family)